MANQKPGLNMTSLENWLWEAACKIRGEVDAPKYEDYMLEVENEPKTFALGV